MAERRRNFDTERDNQNVSTVDRIEAVINSNSTFLLDESNSSFESFQYYKIAKSPGTWLFSDGRVRVYDDKFLTDVLSLPLHRPCYELFVGLAAQRHLTVSVVNRVLYEALQAHFVNRENKQQMPVNLQLQYDDVQQLRKTPYGLMHRKFHEKTIHIESAFADPNESSKKQFEQLIKDLETIAKEEMKVPDELNIAREDQEGDSLSDSDYWKHRFYTKVSWINSWFPKRWGFDSYVWDWIELYALLNEVGMKGNENVQASKKLMNRYRIAHICEQILEEGCAVATSLQPIRAESAYEMSFRSRLPAQGPSPVSSDAGFMMRQADGDEILNLLDLASSDPDLPVTSGAIGLLSTLEEDFIHATPTIKTFWTEDMELAGIGMAHKVGEMESVIGPPETFHASHVLLIPTNDWLCGITFTTRETAEDENAPLTRRVVGIEFDFFDTKRVVWGDMRGGKESIHAPE